MKTHTRKAVALVISLIMLAALIIVFIAVRRVAVKRDEVTLIKEGWLSETAEDPEQSLYFGGGEKSYVLFLSHELNDGICGSALSFRTNDSFLDAYISSEPGVPGEQIYHFGEKHLFTDPPGTYTHFISVPDNAAGYIVIRTETAYKNKFLTAYDVAEGSANELVLNYIYDEMGSWFPNVLVQGIALGYASYSPGADSYEEIMREADEAMYEVKRSMHS